MSAPPLRAAASGHLAENVLHFVRVLRGAGMALGPAKVLDALAAVEATGIDRREDFRAALCAVLVSRRDQLELFDQAFDLFWRHPRLAEKMIAALLPRVHSRAGAAPPPAIPERLAQALLGDRARRPSEASASSSSTPPSPSPRARSSSARTSRA